MELRKIPKNFHEIIDKQAKSKQKKLNKRHLDQFDLEAEAEGNSIRKIRSMVSRKPVGKRLQMQRQQISLGDSIVTNRVVSRVEKGTLHK